MFSTQLVRALLDVDDRDVAPPVGASAVDLSKPHQPLSFNYTKREFRKEVSLTEVC